MKPQILVSFVFAALLSGTSVFAKKPEFARPPYGGLYEPQGKDERGLWMEADEAERTLRDSPALVRDPAVNAWIKALLCRTVGEDRCKSARVYLVKDQSFNASMSPNGMMIVHTGMLLRLHSEAELAGILGHEFGHFEKRHTLDAFRAGRNANSAIAWITVLGLAANRSTYYMRRDIIFGYYRFKRTEEVEADLIGFEYVRGSPYRHRFATIWIRIVQEDDDRLIAKGLRPGRSHFTGWLDSHPSPLTRASYLSAVETESKGDGDEGVAEYAVATASIMPELYDGLIKSNDFGGADYVLRTRGEIVGWNGQLLFARGELYRLRGNPRDLVNAREFFTTATKFSDAPPEVWRGLGLCEYRLGNIEAGKSALREYLARSPSAKDSASINAILEG